jgi:uncharacterized protein YacL (UPF0231 family)
MKDSDRFIAKLSQIKLGRRPMLELIGVAGGLTVASAGLLEAAHLVGNLEAQDYGSADFHQKIFELGQLGDEDQSKYVEKVDEIVSLFKNPGKLPHKVNEIYFTINTGNQELDLFISREASVLRVNRDKVDTDKPVEDFLNTLKEDKLSASYNPEFIQVITTFKGQVKDMSSPRPKDLNPMLSAEDLRYSALIVYRADWLEIRFADDRKPVIKSQEHYSFERYQNNDPNVWDLLANFNKIKPRGVIQFQPPKTVIGFSKDPKDLYGKTTGVVGMEDGMILPDDEWQEYYKNLSSGFVPPLT